MVFPRAMVPLDDPSPSRPPNPHLWTSLKSPFEKHRHCWENATRFSGWWLVVEPTPLKNMSLSVGILKFSRYGHLEKFHGSKPSSDLQDLNKQRTPVGYLWDMGT